ncbi:MAG: hypothetical protein H0U03_03020 [Actinobacteria bacterium]|nr:hypothetical protein [Actinomycetota bacterium]
MLAELLEAVKAVAEGSLGLLPIPGLDLDLRLGDGVCSHADEETRICEHPSGSAHKP